MLILTGVVVSYTARSSQWLSVDIICSSCNSRRLIDYTSSSPRYRSAAGSSTYRSDGLARPSALLNQDKSTLSIDSPRSFSTDDEGDSEDHSAEGVSVIDSIVNADLLDIDTSEVSSINASQHLFAIDPSLLGFLLLNAVAVLWGSQHVVIKASVDSYPTTSLVNFWRFSLSTLLFSPSLIKLLVGSTWTI